MTSAPESTLSRRAILAGSAVAAMVTNMITTPAFAQNNDAEIISLFQKWQTIEKWSTSVIGAIGRLGVNPQKATTFELEKELASIEKIENVLVDQIVKFPAKTLLAVAIKIRVAEEYGTFVWNLKNSDKPYKSDQLIVSLQIDTETLLDNIV